MALRNQPRLIPQYVRAIKQIIASIGILGSHNFVGKSHELSITTRFIEVGPSPTNQLLRSTNFQYISTKRTTQIANIIETACIGNSHCSPGHRCSGDRLLLIIAWWRLGLQSVGSVGSTKRQIDGVYLWFVRQAYMIVI